MRFYYDMYGFIFDSDFPLLGYSPMKDFPDNCVNTVKLVWHEVDNRNVFFRK